MSERLKETIAQLEGLHIAELRSKASKHFNVTIARTDTREDIIAKIVVALGKGEFASIAQGSAPAPGWARIKLHPVPEGPSIVPINHNGYDAWLPVNVEIDVIAKYVASSLPAGRGADAGVEPAGRGTTEPDPVAIPPSAAIRRPEVEGTR